MNVKSQSFNDFSTLLLKGQIKLLTFGEYSIKSFSSSDRHKRRKVIKYFYDNLYMKKI